MAFYVAFYVTFQVTILVLLSYLFLPRPFPEGNGRGQHAAIKVRVQVHLQGMTNGPIRAKQVNWSSSVIGWQNTGQASTRECTVVADRFYSRSVHLICTAL